MNFITGDRDKNKMFIYPDQDWDLILTIFTLMVAGVIVINYFLFKNLTGIEAPISAVPAPELKNSSEFVDVQALSDVLADFDRKQALFDSYAKTKPEIRDPGR
jgi:hypothetical protein